jgi:hypothetical protein
VTRSPAAVCCHVVVLLLVVTVVVVNVFASAGVGEAIRVGDMKLLLRVGAFGARVQYRQK